MCRLLLPPKHTKRERKRAHGGPLTFAAAGHAMNTEHEGGERERESDGARVASIGEHHDAEDSK